MPRRPERVPHQTTPTTTTEGETAFSFLPALSLGFLTTTSSREMWQGFYLAFYGRNIKLYISIFLLIGLQHYANLLTLKM